MGISQRFLSCCKCRPRNLYKNKCDFFFQKPLNSTTFPTNLKSRQPKNQLFLSQNVKFPLKKNPFLWRVCIRGMGEKGDEDRESGSYMKEGVRVRDRPRMENRITHQHCRHSKGSLLLTVLGGTELPGR